MILVYSLKELWCQYSVEDNITFLLFYSSLQKNMLSHLLMLGVESQWAPVAVRCMVR